MQTMPDIDGTEIIVETTGNSATIFISSGGGPRLATASLCHVFAVVD